MKEQEDQIYNKKTDEELDFCTNAPHPEMIRNYEEEEPCHDNREGK